MLSTGRAVMSQAKLLTIDEPSTGSALLIQQDFFTRINEQLHCLGIAMFLVGQDMRSAFETSTGQTWSWRAIRR